MVWTALVLVLCSVPLHAAWNLMARRQRAEEAYIHGLLKWVALVGLAPAVMGEVLGGPLPGKAILCVLISGLACGAYFYFLAKCYQASDFTVVYPIARALPVLLVGLGDIVRGQNPSTTGWAGMSLVVLGCLLTPLHRFGEFDWRKYIHISSLWMLLTALATVVYSLSDKVGSEVLVKGPISAARYGYYFFAVAFLAYAGLRQFFGPGKENRQKVKWSASLLGAVLNYTCYWLVLWAYQLARQASYIVAFRQLSIVLGVVGAFAIYKERGVAVRITAAVLITAGLLLVGLWG